MIIIIFGTIDKNTVKYITKGVIHMLMQKIMKYRVILIRFFVNALYFSL